MTGALMERRVWAQCRWKGERGHTLVGIRGRRHPQREAGSRPARAFPGGLVSRSVRTRAPVPLAPGIRCWVTEAPGRGGPRRGSGRRARAGVPAAPVSGPDSFSVLLPHHMQLCVHIPRSHSCRQGCSHGHTVAAPLPQLPRLQQTPQGWGLNPRCLFLFFFPPMFISHSLQTGRPAPTSAEDGQIPPSSISGIFSLCPHLAEGGRESERAQSPDAIRRFHPCDLPQGPPSTCPHPGLGLEQAVCGMNGLRCAVFSVETAGVWVGKEFLDTEHFRRE